MWSFLKRILACKCTKEQNDDEANIVEYKDISLYESKHYQETIDNMKIKKYECNISTKRKSKCEDGFREIFGINTNHQKSG